MKNLWAPWRMKYIKSLSKKNEGCIFCNALRSSDDKKNYVLHRSENSFIILNIFPYNTGHLMVVPNKHTSNLADLDDDELLDLMKMTKLALRILKEEYNPDGFNIGANIGRVAGAGIEEHFHIHIVPRWNGDTNFMPVIAETKVIPESLDETYERLYKRLTKQ